MKSFITLSFVAILTSLALAAPPLIPKPVSFNENAEPFKIKTLHIQAHDKSTTAKLLQNSLKKLYGLDATRSDEQKNSATTIKLNLVEAKTNNTAGAYTLDSKQGTVIISSSDPAGIFYGTQTLLQLFKKNRNGYKLPSVTIRDFPRYQWRGLMLDEARHFFGKEHVKHLLDAMAAHKMNRFHWHLTDNQGWRIKIKAYPKLTSIGTSHGEGTATDTPNRQRKDPNENNSKHGGFYTQEDIREIIAYAAERHIEVIPGVNLLSRVYPLCLAYPEVLPTYDRPPAKEQLKQRGKYLSVVREENYEMLDTILGEIAALFPSSYLHIGGEEVNQEEWDSSPEHRKFMEENNLNEAGELQGYFTVRVEKLLRKHGKTMAGWNEVMHTNGLSEQTLIMAWSSTGAGIQSARKGYPTILYPGAHAFFDMKYPGPNENGHWWAGVVDTKRAYNWNPSTPHYLYKALRKNILGVQCGLNTDFVKSTSRVDYQLWPRACATAEVAWSPQSRRHWDDFDYRLGKHLSYLDRLQIQFRVRPPVGIIRKGSVRIKPPHADAEVVFTTDGSTPTIKSPLYAGQKLSIASLGGLRFRTLRPNQRLSKVAQGARRLPVGEWTPQELPKTGIKTLTYKVNLDSKGTWYADIKRNKGRDNIKILTATIRSKDVTVASANISDHTLRDALPMRLRFDLPQPKKGANHFLHLQVKADQGTKSHGSITFDQLPNKELAFSVSSTMKPYGSARLTNLSDQHDDTYFWSNGSVQKGDSVTFTLKQPTLLKNIILPTGRADTGTNALAHGITEFSTDGKIWKKGPRLIHGAATLKFSMGMKIKALRIRALSEQEEWLIVRDPIFK